MNPKNRWVTIYGQWATSTCPLDSLSKETLMSMLAGEVEWRWVDDPNCESDS